MEVFKIMNNKELAERIIVLMEEIAVFKSRYEDHDTGHLRTTVNVLQSRIKELKDEIS